MERSRADAFARARVHDEVGHSAKTSRSSRSKFHCTLGLWQFLTLSRRVSGNLIFGKKILWIVELNYRGQPIHPIYDIERPDAPERATFSNLHFLAAFCKTKFSRAYTLNAVLKLQRASWLDLARTITT